MERLEQSTWNEFVDQLENLNNGITRTKVRYDLLDNSERWFSDSVGHLGPTPVMFMSSKFREINVLDNESLKMNQLYELVNAGQVGVVDSASYPGDFDIVAIQGSMTAEQIKALTVNLDALYEPPALGVAPVLVAAGLAVTALVVGGIITVTALITKQEEIEAEIESKQIELEHQILQNPSILPAWTEYKEAQQSQSRGLIDDLLGTGATGKLMGGAAGVVVIVVAGYFLMKYMEKRKQ